jgi:O-antigen/teichoic acid export membrane protein
MTISPSPASAQTTETTHSAAAEQRRFLKNVSWTTVSMVLRMAFAGGTLAVLGRLVNTGTMGLYGMGWSAAMLGFTVSQNGAAQGIISLPKMDKEHVAAAQLLSVLVSAAIGLAIMAAAPFVQSFYRIPHLEYAFILAGLFVPLMSLPAVDVARAQKDLKFSRLAVIQTVAVVLASVTSLSLAFAHMGLIALYGIQGFIGPFTFILFRLYRVPAGYGRTTRQSVRDVWQIGKHLSLTSLMSVVYQNVPQFVIAKMVSVDALGLYVFCVRILQIISSQLSTMVNTVVYPTFARFRSDPAQVGRSYLQTVRFTFFCLMVPFIALAAAPSSFLHVYGGGKWVAAQGIFFYLVINQMMVCLGANAGPTFMALGRADVIWKWYVFLTAVQSAAVLATARMGILGIVQGLTIATMVMPLLVYWLSKAAHFRFIDFCKNLALLIAFLPLSIGLGTLIQYVLRSYSSMTRFVAAGLAATGLYVALVLATDRQARQFSQSALRKLRGRFAGSNKAQANA